MSHIMISYNHINEKIIKILAQHIEEQGHTVWYDKELSGGQAWWEQILTQVRECDVFIFALSPEAQDSEACNRECKYASELGKPILPVVIADGVSINLLPPILSQIQYVDYTKQDISTVNRLARALNNIPPPRPLPDPLPEPPMVPISYLGDLAEKVATPKMNYKDQCTLLIELKSALRDFEDKKDVYMLIEKLKKRHDLFNNVAMEIDELLVESYKTKEKEEYVLVEKEDRREKEEKVHLKVEKEGELEIAEEKAPKKTQEDFNKKKTEIDNLESEKDSKKRGGKIKITGIDRIKGAVKFCALGLGYGLFLSILMTITQGQFKRNIEEYYIWFLLTQGICGAIIGFIVGMNKDRFKGVLIIYCFGVCASLLIVVISPWSMGAFYRYYNNFSVLIFWGLGAAIAGAIIGMKRKGRIIISILMSVMVLSQIFSPGLFGILSTFAVLIFPLGALISIRNVHTTPK